MYLTTVVLFSDGEIVGFKAFDFWLLLNTGMVCGIYLYVIFFGVLLRQHSCRQG